MGQHFERGSDVQHWANWFMKKPLLTFIRIYVCLKILLIKEAPAATDCVVIVPKLHIAFELKHFPICSLGHFSLYLCTIQHTGVPIAVSVGSVYCVILIVFTITWYHCIVQLHNRKFQITTDPGVWHSITTKCIC